MDKNVTNDFASETNRKRHNEVLKLSSQGYGEREVGNKLHVFLFFRGSYDRTYSARLTIVIMT